MTKGTKKEWALYMHQWRVKNAEKYRAYKKAQNARWRAKNKEKIRASTTAQRLRWPEKYRARTKVGNAIRDGRLIRKPCEVCGQKAHAHHEDYSKPLDVRWFCPLHHHGIESTEYVYSSKGA